MTNTTTTTTTTTTNYDLTPNLAPYLEPQLLIPILQHLLKSNVYPKHQVLNQLYALVTSSTTRLDLAITLADEIQEAGGPRPPTTEFESYAIEINSKLDTPPDVVTQLRDFINENQDELRSGNRLNASALVQEKCNVSAQDIDTLFAFAKLNYAAGRFDSAFELLNQYRLIAPNYDHALSQSWGRLAASILSESQKSASLQAVIRVREAIDGSNLPTQSHILEQRVWQLHWSLYIVFCIEGGLDRCYDLLLNPEYLNAIETACPWLLRYVVAASALSNQKHTRDISKHLSKDRIRITDPICQVYEYLYDQPDLNLAGQSLGEVMTVCEQDYFLTNYTDPLMTALRKQVLAILSKAYLQLFLADVLTYLHLDSADALFQLSADGAGPSGGCAIELKSSTGSNILDVVVFTHASQVRRSVHEKVDKLTHQSDNTMAQLFKKMH